MRQCLTHRDRQYWTRNILLKTAYSSIPHWPCCINGCMMNMGNKDFQHLQWKISRPGIGSRAFSVHPNSAFKRFHCCKHFNLLSMPCFHRPSWREKCKTEEGHIHYLIQLDAPTCYMLFICFKNLHDSSSFSCCKVTHYISITTKHKEAPNSHTPHLLMKMQCRIFETF